MSNAKELVRLGRLYGKTETIFRLLEDCLYSYLLQGQIVVDGQLPNDIDPERNYILKLPDDLYLDLEVVCDSNGDFRLEVAIDEETGKPSVPHKLLKGELGVWHGITIVDSCSQSRMSHTAKSRWEFMVAKLEDNVSAIKLKPSKEPYWVKFNKPKGKRK